MGSATISVTSGHLYIVAKELELDAHPLESTLSWLFAVGKIDRGLLDVDEQIKLVQDYIQNTKP